MNEVYKSRDEESAKNHDNKLFDVIKEFQKIRNSPISCMDYRCEDREYVGELRGNIGDI
jgi:hypothetical protein